MGLRDIILTLCPTWLRDESPVGPTSPNGGVGGRYMYNLGLTFDGTLDKLTQAVHAWMPRATATPTSLQYLGNDRLMPQGIYQTAAQYAAQLQGSFNAWGIAGSNWSVLKEVLAFISPTSGPYPFAYVSAPTYQMNYQGATTGWVGGHVSQYFDDGTQACVLSGLGGFFAYPAGDTTRPPLADAFNFALSSATEHLNDWDTLSQQHQIGYFALNGNQNYWRWFIELGAGFTQYGQYITAATNASPIAITTAAPHGLTTGAVVSIGGLEQAGGLAISSLTSSGGLVEVATPVAHGLTSGWSVVLFNATGPANAACGVWTVTVVDGTHFTLNGSIFDASVTATGLLYALAFADSSWTITVTGASSFTLNGSTAAGPFTTPTVFSRVYQLAGNTWVAPAPIVFGTPGATIGQTSWAGGAAPSIGLSLPAATIAELRGIVDLWKLAQSNCDTIAISFSPSNFSAQNPSTDPDGRFGRWSRIVSTSVGGYQYVPARFPNARYCAGVQ